MMRILMRKTVSYTPKLIIRKLYCQKWFWWALFSSHCIDLYAVAFTCFLCILICRKQALKNLTWSLPLLSVRLAIPLSFCMFRGQNVKLPQLFDIYIFFSCCLIFHYFEIWEGPFCFLFLWIQHHNKLRREAEERGEKYKIDKLRRNIEMDEYDLLHWRRSFEEREALIRDISWYSHWHYYINTGY